MKNYTKTKIDRVWSSRLLQHLARKWSGSILSTLQPHGATEPRYRQTTLSTNNGPFQNDPGEPVPECYWCGFYWGKGDGGDGDNWGSTRLKLSQPT